MLKVSEGFGSHLPEPCSEQLGPLATIVPAGNKKMSKMAMNKLSDKEYYEDITKKFLEKVRNIRNDISLIDSFNNYFFQLLTCPLQDDEIRNKKDSITYFQKLVMNYFKYE